jgi:hypothetical protein
LKAYFSAGKTLAVGGFESSLSSASAFHVHERIYTLTKEEAANTTLVLKALPSDLSCNQKAKAGSLTTESMFYNPLKIKDALGVEIDGLVVDTRFQICSDSCDSSDGFIVFAYKDGVGVAFTLATGSTGDVSAEELLTLVSQQLEKIAS